MSVDTFATSSNEQELNWDKHCNVLVFEHALAVASSPSGYANLCIAVGARHIGEAILWPRNVVSVPSKASAFPKALALSLIAWYAYFVVFKV